MNTHEREDSLTLEILEAIEQQDDMTQRRLADRLGVALGLANSYLKRCVRKGLIKIHQVPANRYLYYLTPKGFAEKSRLTAEYLSISFNFYRNASNSLNHLFIKCVNNGWNRILFCGASELAEIASVRVLEYDITITGTWDADSNKNKFLHKPLWQSLDAADEFDACLITSLDKAQYYYEKLLEKVAKEKILVTSILGIIVPLQDSKILSPSTEERRIPSLLREEGENRDKAER